MKHPIVERHPRDIRFRIIRSVRRLRNLKGWRRLASQAVPLDAAGPFVINNDGLVFEGDVSSFIDREIYLFGGYETEFIRLFLSCVSTDRRGTLLDVGANVGNHSLEFSRHFRSVHSFEPNLAVCPAFERNLSLNAASNVRLHRVGLGDTDGIRPFYSIPKNNFGLGTFSTVEQYDLPLELTAQYELVKGDTYAAELGIGRIDAVKIDVQGYEPEVITGLARVLRDDRPVVWFEYSAGTHDKLGTVARVRKLFPFNFELFELLNQASGLLFKPRLRRVLEEHLPLGDYVAIPT
jgi:FkbM family methyltransferase